MVTQWGNEIARWFMNTIRFDTLYVCVLFALYVPIIQEKLTLECTKNGKNTAIGF